MLGRLLLAVVLVLAVIIIIPALVVLGPGRTPRVEVEEENSPTVRVLMTDTQEMMEVPLEEYVVGVVAAEMPAEFHIEALKAQAVAARTYTLRKMQRGKVAGDLHPQADVCTDHNHCQAFMDDAAMAARWNLAGTVKYKRKIVNAVAATKGVVLYYGGQFIDPVYHSTSSGRTENSEDVWQYRIPYLRSVASGWDKESPRFRNSVTMTFKELDTRLGTSLNALPASNMGRGSVIAVTKKTATGRAREVKVDGKTFAATEFRSRLGLTSTDFTWTVDGDRVTFVSLGNGHGVGMSQYGANGMAEEGYSYAAILKHYYSGVSLGKAY